MKVHKEKTEGEAAAGEELDGGASPEDEEESSISSTSKPVADMKVTRTFFKHTESHSEVEIQHSFSNDVVIYM
jgi:hypothetical protein